MGASWSQSGFFPPKIFSHPWSCFLLLMMWFCLFSLAPLTASSAESLNCALKISPWIKSKASLTTDPNAFTKISTISSQTSLIASQFAMMMAANPRPMTRSTTLFDMPNYNMNLEVNLHKTIKLMNFECGYNGLPVCIMCERVNRYTVIFLYMLTTGFFYGNMRMEENSC